MELLDIVDENYTFSNKEYANDYMPKIIAYLKNRKKEKEIL